ncbi:hypothetical protein [Streptomyces sp. JB150]|uniref:hypothetical protein n=1 Tax=Streptomyces sp. JB150 TaxID=2714844 RepID=UPI0014098C1A|nr:hypothetical protein [Streptomyces sp. JB150]QIJ63745.1 hypothetical protein G7Z13_18250 [Streptomyces sp. JB150]
MGTRWEGWAATGVVVLGFTLLHVFVGLPAGEKDRAEQAAVARTADDFLHALGRGDGRTACALLTRPAATALAGRHGAADCPSGVAALARPLTSRAHADIAATELTDEHVHPREGEPRMPVTCRPTRWATRSSC